MAKTRDEQFKLSFDSFIKDELKLEGKYILNNLTKNKKEKKHIYDFWVYSQKRVLGFIDRNGECVEEDNDDNSEERLVCDYRPQDDGFVDTFNEFYDKYSKKSVFPTIAYNNANNPVHGSYVFKESYVEIIEGTVERWRNDEDGITGKICVVYNKDHTPYNVSENDTQYQRKYTLLLNRYNKNEAFIERLLADNEELHEDMIYHQKEARKLKKKFIIEQKNNVISESNLINKLRDAYKLLPNKEDCPVCYEEITNEKLEIPRCSHYICNECHKRCDACPICRIAYREDIQGTIGAQGVIGVQGNLLVNRV